MAYSIRKCSKQTGKKEKSESGGTEFKLGKQVSNFQLIYLTCFKFSKLMAMSLSKIGVVLFDFNLHPIS